MAKKRTPTLCEWALGFTIEDYVENRERRQNKNGGKQTSPRFKLEMSTDEESGEDSLKITYPRSDQAQATAGMKKVRFEKTPVKSALKKPAPEPESSEATDTTTEAESTTEPEFTTETETTTEAETTTSGGDQSSDAADSSESSKVGIKKKKKKGKKYFASSESSEANSSDDSELDSNCSCRKCRHRTRHLTRSGKDKCKKSKSTSSESESSELEKKQRKKNSPESSKFKKKAEVIPESENDGENESSSDEETPKAKKSNDETTAKGNKETSASDEKDDGDAKSKKKVVKNKAKSSSDNNVGPQKESSADASEKPGKVKTKDVSERRQKRLPEPNHVHNLHRPNLILPVTAQVLQVEHAIEGLEDPRPNAFHDGQHGVVRVYHGPAYGNPFGTLYPIRDTTMGSLPAGTPHPLMNPYLNGFKSPSNPGELANHGKSPWNISMAVPVAGLAPDKPPTPKYTQHQRSPPQPQQRTASPHDAPGMSGAMNATTGSPQNPTDPDQGFRQNVGHSSYPINVSMYSYGGPIRGDSWSKEGRERYAQMGRDIHQMKDVSWKNNANPGMHDAAAYQTPPQHSNNNDNKKNSGNSGMKPVHPDLQWDTPSGPEVASWVQTQQPSTGVGGAGSWGRNESGNSSARVTNNNWNSGGNNAWGGNETWGGSWEKPPSVNNSRSGSNNSKNSQADSNNTKNSNTGSKKSQTSGGDGWGGDSSWEKTGDGNTWGGQGTWGNSPQASSKSNKSGGTNKSNNRPVVNDSNDWGGGQNNVGVSSRASNASKDSKKSRKGGAAAEQAGDNNAGPIKPQEDDTWATGKIEDPSQNMPGAFNGEQGGMENATFRQTGPPKDTGGFSWGDTSAAQVVAADTYAW